MSDHFDRLRAAIARAEAAYVPPPMDAIRLLCDLCQVLDPIKRNGLRTLLQALTANKTALETPSVTQAFLEQAPAVVGAVLWRQCCEKQRPRGRRWWRREPAGLVARCPVAMCLVSTNPRKQTPRPVRPEDALRQVQLALEKRRDRPALGRLVLWLVRCPGEG